jgi:penicillin-binding protein 2
VDLENQEGILAELAKRFSVEEVRLIEAFEKKAFTEGEQRQVKAEKFGLILDIDYEKFLENYDFINDLEGFSLESEAGREYLYPETYAHIIGYQGNINADEVEKTGLDINAKIGKEGLEKSYDSQLRGEDGLEVSEVVPSTRDIYSWTPKSFKSGDNLYLTIDHDWQEELYRNLDKYANESGALGGAGIIMNTETGEVMAMANYPSFDVNLFSSGISTDEFNQLLNNDRTPLLNRSLAMQIPSGSTFKVIMASILQEEGAVGKTTVFQSGCFELPGGYELCEADRVNYGQLNLTQAIARSSNPYFCQAAVAHARKAGSDLNAIRSWEEFFELYGFGERIDMDLPGSQPGTVPSPELKLERQGEPWYLADLCNTAIGQGLVSTTPLHMARAVAAIENGGKVLTPQLVLRSETETGRFTDELSPEVVSEIGISQSNLENVKTGMREAVEYGSAVRLKDAPFNPRAKTGSSEATEKTQSGRIIEGAHSWVIGAFDYEGETYSFAVSLQFGGRGFRSVPVMTDFLKCLESDFQC